MALEAAVFPPEPFSYGFKDFYSVGGGLPGGYEFSFHEEEKSQSLLGIFDNHLEGNFHANWDYSSPPSVLQNIKVSDPNSSPETCTVDQSAPGASFPDPATNSGARRKRRRTRSCKNREEIENQRMTHITVERNRRKQMNEYLAVLRSMMPPSYVQRGDQASIIGGAINFVKELEQMLQTMEGNKQTKEEDKGLSDSPLSEFFTFPQYTTKCNKSSLGDPENNSSSMADQNQSCAVADIQVTMVDTHASVKILSKKRPRQLLKMVAALQGLRLTVLHLNVTTVDQMVLYSLSVKIEEGCHLNTVDEIAAAVNQMLRTFQEEPAFN
ncbi:hypothetical protein UlMin_034796 [Ulmus minor]